MEILNDIKNLSDEQLECYVLTRIDLLERESSKLNSNLEIIGYDLDINPKPNNVLCVDDHERSLVPIKCIHAGYVKKNMKMVYGIAKDPKKGLISNYGYYYIIDTDDYVLEFCKYIRNKTVESEFDLFLFIERFLVNYFKSFRIDDEDRDIMFKSISKDEDYLYEPVREHKFSRFKGSGAAVCTEFALAANNIINFFDIESYIVVGNMTDDGDPGAHAYNIVYFGDESEKGRDYAIVDFGSYVKIYDINYNEIGIAPYIMEIERFDDEFMDRFVREDICLTDEKHIYMSSQKYLMRLALKDKKREYYIGGNNISKEYTKNYFNK